MIIVSPGAESKVKEVFNHAVDTGSLDSLLQTIVNLGRRDPTAAVILHHDNYPNCLGFSVVRSVQAASAPLLVGGIAKNESTNHWGSHT